MTLLADLERLSGRFQLKGPTLFSYNGVDPMPLCLAASNRYALFFLSIPGVTVNMLPDIPPPFGNGFLLNATRPDLYLYYKIHTVFVTRPWLAVSSAVGPSVAVYETLIVPGG